MIKGALKMFINWRRKRLETKINKRIDHMMGIFEDELEQEWHRQIDQRLDTTADKYKEGLSFTRSDKGTVKARLTGFLPVALEEGTEPYDLKPGFLRGINGPRIIPIQNKDEPLKFRTVGQHSGPDDWWHPGFQARDIRQAVEDEMDKILERVSKKAKKK